MFYWIFTKWNRDPVGGVGGGGRGRDCTAKVNLSATDQT